MTHVKNTYKDIDLPVVIVIVKQQAFITAEEVALPVWLIALLFEKNLQAFPSFF